ncbi:hypothetical protein RM704_10375 [Streptomyces sp. DSM 3412]|uniref:Transposase n=1 Tax=Streptomyces gottesmaniae TaxID=3075518 RepID=A0ABU2YWT5_9ACTN|nr:hypothetical protein [Streptomyces sp. DSM 3412]MDT0567869.1 hypothetical protein [Streptomyces sp. DSM 3412]
MSAYTTGFQALTSGRALRPDEAAALLADLRREAGQELADALEKDLDGKYRRTDTDTDGEFRRKRRKYGAAMATVNRLREFAASSLLLSPPHQRNRSTS